MSNPENTAPDLASLRLDYRMASLRRNEVAPDPFVQFRAWFDQVHRSGVVEPNAMTLATCGAGGVPSARIVLLKGLDDRGFTFFTNYESRKGRDVAENPRAALTFFWRELEREVCVRGTVERVTREESEDYFRQRPYDSRIGAHASQQSSVIPGREWLEERFAALRAQYPDEVPLPDTWGGYRLVPDYVEFWQGRPGRLHDRICYTPDAAGWRIDRLSP